MEVERVSKVSFGTTTERIGFPIEVGNSRFGNGMNPIGGFSNVGPGKYENDEMTGMIHQMNTRPMSKKGYALGARCAPRHTQADVDVTPASCDYQSTSPRHFEPAYKPFNVAAQRDPQSKRLLLLAGPGPGTYNNTEVRCRQVQYAQSFGRTPMNLPSITQQSTISRNTDKLMTTKEERRYLQKLAYLKLYY